jgi:hypothetical protein
MLVMTVHAPQTHRTVRHAYSARYARMSAVAGTEVERHTGVDLADAPSAEWGWSGTAPRLWNWVLIFIGLFLLAMMRGNHVGWVENWFLIGFAAVIFVVVGREWYLRRRGRIH